MKVTILIPSLASNGIARAWILAQLLGRHYEIEAIGRLRDGETVCPWFAGYAWIPVRANGLGEAMRAMEARITGDIVVAYGISMTSFGVGLLAKYRAGRPLLLDLPEWEVHDHFKSKSGLSRAGMIVRNLVGPGWSNPHSFKYRYVLDHLTRLADVRTVCCEFMRERYGGVVLPQGPDTEQFDPGKFDKGAMRRKWGIPEDVTVLFFGGNPQTNKGLEETVAALEALDGRLKARLVIVGRDESHPYTRHLLALGRGKVLALGPQPFHVMPELLATADIAVLPQNTEPKSLGYIPCKMYEAMAMEIPVISSRMCDIPTILDGCGYVVPPDDVAALRAAIEHVLTHPEEAREMGRRARRRVIERYSWPVMDRILQSAVESLAPAPERGSPHRAHPASRPVPPDARSRQG